MLTRKEASTMSEHSPKFGLVKGHYENKRWNEAMVRNAVGKWITADEADEILGIASGENKADE